MSRISFSTAQPNPTHPGIIDVAPEEVFKNREHLCLIDVRGSDEYVGELGHAAGTKLITLDTLPGRLNDLPKDKPIVFICRSGGRSGKASALAKEEGFTDIFNMKGGMILWNQLTLEVEGKNS